MAYSKELIEQFKVAYKARFGVLLTDDEAADELRELSELVRLTTEVKTR